MRAGVPAEVRSFEGLLVRMRSSSSHAIVRGSRHLDYEYDLQMALDDRRLEPRIRPSLCRRGLLASARGRQRVYQLGGL